MTTTTLSPLLVQRFADNNNNPLVNGQLYTYAAGTSTPIATYTDSTGGTTNTNPVILNSRGECNVWLSPNTGYKFVLQDSLGNTIWTVDQVINSQLITLYGGVDIGALNAYVLNFQAPYTSLVDGIVIYWIPSTTNTGPSVLNVNSLGSISIVTPNGAALAAGQINANQPAAVIYKSGNWILLSSSWNYLSGSFSGTFTGFVTSGLTTTFTYVRTGGIIILYSNPGFSSTSNATTMTVTGLPAAITPNLAQTEVVLVTDAGANAFGTVFISGTTLTFSKGPVQPGGFTNSGLKGIPGGWSVVYAA